MMKLREIQAAIAQLSPEQVLEFREWFEQWLEDHQAMTPEFLASIERGKSDLREDRIRRVSGSQAGPAAR